MNALLYPGTMEGFRICTLHSVQCQGNVSLIYVNRKQACCIKDISILMLCINITGFNFEKESHNLSYLLLWLTSVMGIHKHMIFHSVYQPVSWCAFAARITGKKINLRYANKFNWIKRDKLPHCRSSSWFGCAAHTTRAPGEGSCGCPSFLASFSGACGRAVLGWQVPQHGEVL